MRNLGFCSFILPFVLCLLSARSSQGYVEYSNLLPKNWRASLGLGKERLTNLHFYFHDRSMGENATAVKVASAPITAKSPAIFGELRMADDRLMEGPYLTSEEVGRAQGLYGFASMEEMSIIMAMSFSFSKGEFKGSSLSMVSQNTMMQSSREMSIVGGTGKFRLARGIVTAKTWKVVAGYGAIVEYHVKVLHYY